MGEPLPSTPSQTRFRQELESPYQPAIQAKHRQWFGAICSELSSATPGDGEGDGEKRGPRSPYSRLNPHAC